MFWILGSEEESRPVAVAASANEVCTRLVRAIHLFASGVGIGRFELGQLTPFENLRRHRVQRRQLFEDRGRRCRRRRSCLSCRRQPEFLEQHIAQLLGRADVEFMPDIAPDRPLELGDARAKSCDRSASAARSTLTP